MNADTDPAIKLMRIHADPDPQPWGGGGGGLAFPRLPVSGEEMRELYGQDDGFLQGFFRSLG